MEAASLTLWVRSEPFDYGAIHIPLPPKLTLHNLHKLCIYSRSKGKAGYPKISYSLWKHVACFKLGMSAEQAWIYFETFDMLCESSFKDSNSWTRQYPHCKTTEETENLKGMMSVNTLQFILFLFIQQIHKISFKASLVSGGEEWPTHSRSPELDHKGSFATKSLDEHDHMMFVLHHLNEILELLMEPESNLSGTSSTESCLTLEAVDALGFLFSGTLDGKKVLPIEELASQQPEASKAGYSKITRSFSFRHFQSWLQSHLQISPYGVSEILSQATKAKDILSLSDSFDDHSLKQADSKEFTIKGRIMSNVVYASSKQKLVIMSRVCKQTVAKASDIYSGSDVKIHRCHYSYIYILCPLRSVTIQRCHNTTIVLGCVKTMVHIIGCENVTFIMVCNRVAISGCMNCTFHLCCPTQPLILMENESLTLAPYHTFYAKLEEHLKSQWGVKTITNQWNNPLMLGNGSQELVDSQNRAIYRELPVQEFFTFNIPFNMKGSTDASPIPLPVKYEEALQERENAINGWYQMVKNSSLAKTQRQQLQSVVQNRFQDWLAESGEASQLNGLVPSHSPKHSQEHSKH